MQLEHVEAAIEGIVRAISTLRLDDVVLIEAALQAGWLSQPERERLAPLAEAFGRLAQS